MSDDFKDSFRKAAGVPTSKEVQVAADKTKHEQAEWAAGEPLRAALKAKFNQGANLHITKMFNVAKTVANERQFDILETNIVRMGVENLNSPIAERHFSLGVLNAGNRSVSNLRSALQNTNLVFALRPDGNFFWKAEGKPDNYGGKSINFNEADISETEIADAFKALLSALPR